MGRAGLKGTFLGLGAGLKGLPSDLASLLAARVQHSKDGLGHRRLPLALCTVEEDIKICEQ